MPFIEMLFQNRASSVRFSRSMPLVSHARLFKLNARRLFILGIGFLLVALLTLPLAQKNSSAHETTSSSKTGATLSPLSIPNDTCATSVPLQLGTEVSGTLVSAVDDYELSGAGCFTGIGQSPVPSGGSDAVYSFTAPATATYSFKVTDPVPGNFVLYTASTCPAATPGTPVVVDTCQNASNRSPVQASEEVLCQPMDAGETVYIFVDQVINGGTTFKIQVTRCNYETEPNDTPATANPFIFGVEGSINPGTDVDFFSLGTPPAGSRVFALLDGSASNGSNYQLRVTTSTDTLEFDDDNATFLFGNVAPVIAGTPLTGVPSFLRIDSAASTAREPYRLYAVVEPSTATAVPESEPNNSLATANSNPLNYFSGSIAAGATADVDFYSFGAAAGDLIFIALDNDPQRNGTPFNGDVALVDSSNTVLYAADDIAATSNTSSGAGSLSATTPFSPADALIYRIQASGTYYARVSSSGIGDYLLAISNNGNGGPTAANGVVSGRVRGVDGSPIGGVVVTLNGNESRRTITDSDGNYRFESLATNSFYTVSPALVNHSFNPASRSFSLITNQAEATFTAIADEFATQNPLDTPEYFVRQQYLDMLGREPDEGGLNYWSNQLLACGTDARCMTYRRRDVGAAFFIEQEFQQTGAFIYGIYEGSFGRMPTYSEFSVDRPQLVASPNLEAMKQEFTTNFVQRTEFVARYQAYGSPESFVDAMIGTVQQASGVDLSARRQSLLNRYNAGGTQIESRSLVVRDIIEDTSFRQAEYSRAFVLSEYFSYLRRDPEPGGFAFWVDVLNNRDTGNYRGMVCAFITSSEYQLRFSSVVSQRNSDCGQ